MNQKPFAWLYDSNGYKINLTMEEHMLLMRCLCKHWGPSKSTESLNKEVVIMQKPAQYRDSNIIHVDFSRKTLASVNG